MKVKLVVAMILFVAGCCLEGIAGLVLSSAELALVLAKIMRVGVA